MGSSLQDHEELDTTERLPRSPLLGLWDLAPAGPRVECTHPSHTRIVRYSPPPHTHTHTSKGMCSVLKSEGCLLGEDVCEPRARLRASQAPGGWTPGVGLVLAQPGHGLRGDVPTQGPEGAAQSRGLKQGHGVSCHFWHGCLDLHGNRRKNLVLDSMRRPPAPLSLTARPWARVCPLTAVDAG